MQSSFPQLIHRCQNEVYKTYTEKYFHRKVGSSTVLFPIVSSTMGTLRSRPPQQMAPESSPGKGVVGRTHPSLWWAVEGVWLGNTAQARKLGTPGHPDFALMQTLFPLWRPCV